MSTILFVDDDESIGLVAQTFLNSLGYQVELATDGPAALAAIEKKEPDLVILDLSMPSMSGLEVCRVIRGNPFTARIPVLMLTAHTDLENKIEGFEAGADDYLGKPFELPELSARITAILRLVRREGDRNPTSGLPGGRVIHEEIERRAACNQPFAICYIDLDNFKPFADTFGFAVADSTIREAGIAIRAAVESLGNPGDFVGHIGGDDFVVVTSVDQAKPIAQEATARFRQAIVRAIGEEAVQRDSFTGVDREGRVQEFPITQLAVVVVLIQPAHWVSVAHLGALAAEGKRKAKRLGPGTILVQSA